MGQLIMAFQLAFARPWISVNCFIKFTKITKKDIIKQKESPKANETESSGRFCEIDLFQSKYYTTGNSRKSILKYTCYHPDEGEVKPVRGMFKAGTICKDLEDYCQPVTIGTNIHGLEGGTRGPGGKVFVDSSVSYLNVRKSINSRH